MTTVFDVFRARDAAGRRRYQDLDSKPMDEWCATDVNRAYREWRSSTIQGMRDLARSTSDPFVTYIVANYARVDANFWSAAHVLMEWDRLYKSGKGPEFFLRLTELADELGWCDDFLCHWSAAQKAGFIPDDLDPVEIFRRQHPCDDGPSFQMYGDDEY